MFGRSTVVCLIALAAPGVAQADPLAAARASIGKTRNLEAAVPPFCYTRTGGVSNPCWTCHTGGTGPNHRSDFDLQREYAFGPLALVNHWTNLFVDRRTAVARTTDSEILKYIREDNYGPLRRALAGRRDYPGYVPDLDLGLGVDEEGFAKDGSGWRVIRYKPFPGTFWPTNGSSDDVYVRLPAKLRETRALYRENLALLEEAMNGRAIGSYRGGASDVKVRAFLYPIGTEFLHSVRYLDPDQPTLLSARMKELRYARKVEDPDEWGRLRKYEKESDEKQEGRSPVYRGNPLTGLVNTFGWQLQGFIEDAGGALRLQTEEEHRFCMGCHSGIGVTVDSTFAFPRKVPGADGFRPQDLRGMTDSAQAGHTDPEVLTYFRRVGAGDELRANGELLARFFPRGKLDEAAVRRAAPGGDRDLAWLLAPSRRRALDLDKAYLAVVREQSFTAGRDAVLKPAKNVHRQIENGDTELGRAKKLFRDGRLPLVWR